MHSFPPLKYNDYLKQSPLTKSPKLRDLERVLLVEHAELEWNNLGRLLVNQVVKLPEIGQLCPPGPRPLISDLKSGIPTLELTRTQKRRVQRQYCTFLKNKDHTQLEQTTYEPEELTKTESPRKPSIYHVSPPVNQLEPSQSQSQFRSIPVEGQKDWIEKYEEEQLDYEPSTDDQTGLLETDGQEDWTEEYGEEHMKYDGELEEETEAFEKFRAAEGQKNTLEGDVLSQETFEFKLAEVDEAPEQQIPTAKTGRTAMKLAAEQLCFSKPTKEMANHLRPLFITANFGGVHIPKVADQDGRTEKDLIPTRLMVTNFAGGITKTQGILNVDVIVGTKKLKIAFFVVDTTSTTYNALLDRDWIHQSLCVPSTLHQQLALSHEEGFMEIVEAGLWLFFSFALFFEAKYYHDDLGPFTFF
ncbi:unnamed protein product [Prunus armeniaca]